MASTLTDSDSRTAKCYVQPPSYQTFLSEHLEKNLPCVIGPELIQHWPALHDWTIQSASGQEARPNWEFFLQRFGMDVVSVADCRTVEFGDQQREAMTVKQLMLTWLRSEIPYENTAIQIKRNGDIAERLLYLKDWHLRQLHPDYRFYNTPAIFRDDWMNDYYINARSESKKTVDEDIGPDDFRFVYMGKQGTFTPLHRDVYCSYSWSTNIVGYKRWILFPPSVSAYLYAPRESGQHTKERGYDVTTADRNRFPNLYKAMEASIMLEQAPHETIFVPSGWYHQVENITDCISINHNWANGNCIENMYDAMCEEIAEVEHALSDVKQMMQEASTKNVNTESETWHSEWTAIVQDVLTKNSGWGWLEFWGMTLHAVESRFNSDSGSYHSPLHSWDSAPASLRAPLQKEIEKIRSLVHRFMRDRSEAADINGLLGVLQKLKSAVDGLSADAGSHTASCSRDA